MLSTNIRNARKSTGMTQKEVASILGVTESTYCGYETGKRQPDALKIGQMAKLFGVTGDYLLDIEETEKAPATEKPAAEVSEDVFLNLYRGLDAPKKALILYLLEKVASQTQSEPPAVPR